MPTRSELIERVKARVDELVPFGDSSVVLPANELLRPIEALAESELDNATLELLERAPLHLLKPTEHNLYTLTIGDDKVSYLNMPDDFLRLAFLWLRGWHRPVTHAISRENPLYKLQRNPYTRGGNAKPMAVLVDRNPLIKARWELYQCQREVRGYAESNTGKEVAAILDFNHYKFSPLNGFESHTSCYTIQEWVWVKEAERATRVANFYRYLSKLVGVDVAFYVDSETPDIRTNGSACAYLEGVAYINVSSSNQRLGLVTGEGWYNLNKMATVLAAPTNIGIFSGWYEGNTLVSGSLSYPFTVTGNRSLTATFTIKQYTLTLTTEDVQRGTVSGGGMVDAGQMVSVSVEANDGWKFDAWYYNGQTRREDIPQNGVFKPYEDCTLVARFKRATAVVKATVNSPTLGTTAGSGTYELGSTCTIKAEPISCSKFLEWRVNGIKVSDNPEYSFTVTEDNTYTAIFEVAYVTVQVTSDTSKGTATVNSMSSVTVARCTYVSLKAEGKDVWVFQHWKISGVVQPQLGATASYKAESAVTLEAVFYKPAIYVYADGYDTMEPYENHKYYGRAYISQAISCPITAYCWLQVGGQTFEYSATILAGQTESSYTLVYESIPDPDLRDCGCHKVSISECEGYPIAASPGYKPY